MTRFQISSKQLTRADLTVLGPGYSGAPGHVDDASAMSEKSVGPIPIGSWTIGAPVDLPVLGPFCLPLKPELGTETFGRGGFWIHGDNDKHDESASHGCIVTARAIREEIWSDPDHLLLVVE